jgi:hypothetical protein
VNTGNLVKMADCARRFYPVAHATPAARMFYHCR